jgi:4-hydroxybenzoate polyprenyltransferase
MLNKAKNIIRFIEKYPLTLPQFILSFSAIIALRMLGENLLSGFEGKSVDFFIGSTLAAYLFFLFSFVLLVIFLSAFLRESSQKIANILLWGFFIVIFPPIFDKNLCGAQKCWSFYTFDSFFALLKRFLTFFGDSPTIGITYGVRIEVALAVLFVIFLVYIKQNRVVKALLAGVATYAILFILGSFPSWLSFLFLWPQKSPLAVQNFDIAALFLSPAGYFSFRDPDFVNALNVKMNLIYAFLLVPALVFFFWRGFWGKFWPVVRNIRWIQIAIHCGLVLFGAGLGAFYFPKNLTIDIFSFLALANLILAFVFAWLASVFLNDEVDLEIDKITNRKRPTVTGEVAPGDYHLLFWMCFALSLILALTVGVKFFLIALVYQTIGWIYSCEPFRLKRFPGIATFFSALALTLLFLSGFALLADNQNISAVPPKIFWLLIIAFTVSLPIKDLKDIEGDRKNGIWTIPVLLGEAWARFAIGLGIFASYALSVIWLNVKILFVPAMVLGAASFWILQSKSPPASLRQPAADAALLAGKAGFTREALRAGISARRVHIFVFGLLFVYVLLIAWMIFWPMIKVRL